MSENRRPAAGHRSRTTRHPRARKPDVREDASKHEETRVKEATENNNEMEDNREYPQDGQKPGGLNPELRTQRQHPDEIAEDEIENSGPGNQHRHDSKEMDMEPEEEPFENQPTYLGRSNEIESQPSDKYMIETHFDPDRSLFTGSILEFPELKAQGSNRELVMTDLEAQLGQKLENLRQDGAPIPAPLAGKQYPDSLQIRLSQSLFRHLDKLSRFEKVDIDRLVVELITRALERQGDTNRNTDRRPPMQGQSHHGNRHGHRHQNRRGGGQHRGGRSYNDSSQSKENFMEYVRNLENRGGGGNWRKK